jgi:hypothetical protein
MFGDPEPRFISPSMVERNNLTMRMQMRRFARRAQQPAQLPGRRRRPPSRKKETEILESEFPLTPATLLRIRTEARPEDGLHVRIDLRFFWFLWGGKEEEVWPEAGVILGAGRQSPVRSILVGTKRRRRSK